MSFFDLYSQNPCEKVPYHIDSMANKFIKSSLCVNSIDIDLKDFKTRNMQNFSSKYIFLTRSRFY